MPIPMFTLKHTLVRHTKPINVLSISPDGALLLSGADDGLVTIWDLEHGNETQTLSLLFHGPVCALVWTPLNPDFGTAAFALGSSDGTIQLFRRSRKDVIGFDFASLIKAHDAAVEGMAYDLHHRRLASVGGGCLMVWDMDANAQLSSVAGTPERPYIARSVAFFDRGQAVLVCYLENHEVMAYNVNPWSMRWTHTLRHRIGYASMSADERLLITSNLKDAVDIYSIPPSQHIRSLSHPIRRNVPLTVCSALDGALTLAGSDDGAPRIFDQRVGTLAQALPHGNVGSLVQAVAAHSEDKYCVLVTGSSDADSTVEIKVWVESKQKETRNEAPMAKMPSQPRAALWYPLLQILTAVLIQLCVIRGNQIYRYILDLCYAFQWW